MSVVEAFIKKYGRLPTERDPDYLEMLRMSKYRVLTSPDVKPGKCANCGSCRLHDRYYVDFGLHIDWYGCVFICTLCLDDIAKNVGLFSNLEKEIEYLRKGIRELTINSDNGKSLEATVLKTFEEVKDHFTNLRTSGDNSDVGRSVDVGSDSPDSNKSSSDEPQSAFAEAESRIVKSNSGGGPKKFRSLTDLLDDTDKSG